MRCGRLVRRVFRGLAIGLLPLAEVASAQTTGSIVGRVVDSSGAPLPGVTVEASSASLQGVRARVTGAYGEYRFPALPPGEYRVRAVLEGFRPAEKSVRVGVGSAAAGDLTLSLATSETIKVSGEVPFVDTSSTSSATTYLAAIIRYLPCGRDYASVVKASPGVATDRGATQMRSLALAIRGATSAENLWNVDGVNTTDVQRGIQGKAVNSEFVEEVQVVSGGYQAEYGRSLGGIVNVVTKSGGNAFHGEGFVYYDSSATAARPVVRAEDQVAATMRLVDYTRRDFGADLGGYLFKDRLWFFAAYDHVELPAQVSPSADSPDGSVTTSTRFPLDATTNLYSGKLTWTVAAGTSVVASVVGDPTTNSGAGAADPRLGYGSFVGGSASGPQPQPIANLDPATWNTKLSVGGVDFGVRATQLFGSHDAAELQAGVHHDRFQLSAAEGVRVEDWTCARGTPDAPCSIPGAPNSVSGGFGWIFGPFQDTRSRRSELRADWTHYAGDHTLKMGGDYQRAASDVRSHFTGGQLVQIFNDQGFTYYGHAFFGRSLENPFSIAPSTTVTTTIRDFGAYLEDSWKPSAGWTMNAALRWDREDILDPRFAAFIRTDKFQPRVGVVWDPAKNGRSKVFAFAGRFFWGLPSDVGARTFSELPFVFSANFSATDVAPDPGLFDQVSPPGREPTDPNLKAMYQDEASVGVERQFAGGLSVGLTATYRRLGNSIEDRCDLDPGNAATNYSTCGITNPGSNARIARGDIPGCNGLDANYLCFDTIPATPRAKRVYKGIELLARKSVGQRLWLQASYVYSSLRGNYDGAINQSTGQTDPGINADFDYYLFDHNLEGRLFLDQPHRFRLDGYYATPLGIAVGLQAFAASGVPLDRLGYFNQFYGPSVHLVPRGSAGRMPTQWDANLSLAYPIAWGSATVTLQAYVFNLFNNQIPTYRRTDWSTSPPSDYPASLYDPNQEQTNPDYGKVVTRTDPRVFRGAVRISF